MIPSQAPSRLLQSRVPRGQRGGGGGGLTLASDSRSLNYLPNLTQALTPRGHIKRCNHSLIRKHLAFLEIDIAGG